MVGLRKGNSAYGFDWNTPLYSLLEYFHHFSSLLHGFWPHLVWGGGGGGVKLGKNYSHYVKSWLFDAQE